MLLTFWAPHSFPRYNENSNMKNWLVAQYISIYLANLARSWLEHLNKGSIQDWSDHERLLINHFVGAYTKPGSMWELASYQCNKDESLWDNDKCFTQKKNKLHTC